MENNSDDRFVANEMKKLYRYREEGLDEFKIGNHKSGGCSICYDGGVQAIKSYKGGVKVYKKENPNDAIHIDIDSHNQYSSSSESESESDEDFTHPRVPKQKGGNYERNIGGRKLVDKMQLPSSSMAGGKKKLNPKMEKRMKKVKEIMKERGVNMIEASKIIKKENIKY